MRPWEIKNIHAVSNIKFIFSAEQRTFGTVGDVVIAKNMK
jgi:hypothetical protein